MITVQDPGDEEVMVRARDRGTDEEESVPVESKSLGSARKRHRKSGSGSENKTMFQKNDKADFGILF
jgi:hypothetical protein